MSVDPATLARFRSLLGERLGWIFADSDVTHVGAVLHKRSHELGLAPAAYLRHLGERGWPDEQSALVEALSITETYFFRHAEQMHALIEAALPERLRARATRKTLRMLSVACSSGEEPYTLQMVAREAQPDPTWHISTVGLDANPVMLRKAKAGRYSSWSLRETPEHSKSRWFRRRDDHFELDPALRAEVQFRQYNVADDDAGLWRPDQYDIVFCRNLLMYLTPGVAADLVRRMTGALATGGYLFLGHTDTLGSRPEGLEPQHTHGTFYYRRTGTTRAPARFEPAATGTLTATAAAPLRVSPPKPTPPKPAVDRDRVLGLLRAEGFAEALALVERSLPQRPTSQDLLLYGVVLAQNGRLDQAEQVSRRLLELDGLFADAHHLLGVCFEGMAAAREAIEHYRLAAYLDKAFALPRLRLGLLLRRGGDSRGAAAELSVALDLLRGEREDRVVLFGGGFGRASLVALCRSELDLCGVSR